MVIESFTQKVKSIARAAAIWRPLAETQDALAADQPASAGADGIGPACGGSLMDYDRPAMAGPSRNPSGVGPGLSDPAASVGSDSLRQGFGGPP